MKTMNRIFVVLLMAFVWMGCASKAQAASYARSPKAVFVSSSTTGSIQVTPAVSTNAVAAAAYMPGAVYQVELSTGAASEYVVLFDSANCTGLSAVVATDAITTHLVFTSTTTNTEFKFDPPLLFEHGLCVIDSAATGAYSITYELGRGLSGN